VVDRLKWCLPLKLQKLLLEVGNHHHPVLKLSTMHLVGVLKVNNPLGTDMHLLLSDVEQLPGVIPSMLGITKAMICYLQLMVLL
jgi:hypothetical protein